MKPYFETDNGKLYHGDCLEVMPMLNRKFDLCLTDPPYGINEAAGKNKSRGRSSAKWRRGRVNDYDFMDWDNKIPDKKIFELIFQLSGNQIIFGGNYFVEYLKNSPCWIVWDKQTSGDFADSELIYTSFKKAVRNIRWLWSGFRQRQKEKRYHPTQKPVGLIEIILSKYSENEDSVIDPFGGVGTTAIACENLDHSWILIEREESYCEIAAKRIEAIVNQLSF